VGPARNRELNVPLAKPATTTLARTGVVAALAAVALGVLVLPVRLCLVATLFHVPCPGCGLTRAAFAMARGDLGGAFALHPMSLFLVPLLAVVVSAHALRYVRTGSAWNARRLNATSEALFAALALLLVAVWIARWFGWFGGPVSV
jgi:hypothetical protein